ncbi:hypothetical protein ACA31_03070 [Staphylococcus sp. NAM3COL9]|nr:hypothetical protein ACA31_03070 [Staphylococcus sp. NAM3COL9]
MILSDTMKVKYKLNTRGMNTVEVARMLKKYRVSGFLIAIKERHIIVAVPREHIKSNRKLMEGLRNAKHS